MGGANLRLRLEPTLNVTDQVRVHAQIDVLDNTIMGSTPDSLAGIDGFNRAAVDAARPATCRPTCAVRLPVHHPGPARGRPERLHLQHPRQARLGARSTASSARSASAACPGTGDAASFYNDGSCPDCDVGTTVDRVMALTQLYGHQLALAWDLGAQGRRRSS